MSDHSTKISLAALAISIASFGVSWYFGFRDRYKLKTESKFFQNDELGPAQMTVKVVNVGRRLVILQLFGGLHADGGTSGTYLGEDGKGLYLKENEVFAETLHWDDLQVMDPYGNDDKTYSQLWVEDTRGHRHKIKNSKKNINKLLESK